MCECGLVQFVFDDWLTSYFNHLSNSAFAASYFVSEGLYCMRHWVLYCIQWFVFTRIELFFKINFVLSRVSLKVMHNRLVVNVISRDYVILPLLFPASHLQRWRIFEKTFAKFRLERDSNPISTALKAITLPLLYVGFNSK